ncbi:MAG: sensor histidine kinase [Actinomycetaceae bacterium]|nr:sensor histidine kinase [Arcanobacterium sp.]MDD7687724.1 sensor histidine kinase [Actinomycetaceae bacterium]MDY5274247.1 sensor histidine kinase [Arcanobacterium sp.]
MATLAKILEVDTQLPTHARKWLQQLVGDWQIVADIAFSDVLLYVCSNETYVVAAQTRPATAATLFESDLIGEKIERDFEETIQAVMLTGEQLATQNDDSLDTWVPVPCDGSVVAVMRVSRALVPDRVPLASHECYDWATTILLEMVEQGAFPIDGAPSSYRPGAPRVVDGVLFMNADGVVQYASPNAVSVFRTYGIDEPLTGSILGELVANHIEPSVVPEETLPVVLLGKAAWLVELESRDIVITLRAVPLIYEQKRVGAMLLCRDITSARLSEREIMSRDATIKEINHRVKNNLQTVSALLRMQARRAGDEQTRSALAAAQRRVEMIAIVHEQLSQTIDEVAPFDDVFGSLLTAVRDVAVTDAAVDIAVEGSFGLVRAEEATALAVVLNEIISNAIEHGLREGGKIQVRAQRRGTQLVVEVEDDGEGMHGKAPTPGISSLEPSSGGASSGLGTKIVRTLVASDLHGKISWLDVHPHGTLVRIEANIDALPDDA